MVLSKLKSSRHCALLHPYTQHTEASRASALQFLQLAIKFCGLSLSAQRKRVSRLEALVSWNTALLASHNCWLKSTSWEAAHEVVPPSGHQLASWSGLLIPQACNGHTTPQGVMYHPRQSTSNVVVYRRVFGRGHVRPVYNSPGATTSLVTGKQHHRARRPHPSSQRSPVK